MKWEGTASTSPGCYFSALWPGTDPRADLTVGEGVAGKSSGGPEAGVAVSYPLTRLSGCACMEAGHQEPTLYLLSSTLSQSLGPGLPSSPPCPSWADIPPLPTPSQPASSLLLSFHSPRPGVPIRTLQDPRADRVKSQQSKLKKSLHSRSAGQGGRIPES